MTMFNPYFEKFNSIKHGYTTDWRYRDSFVEEYAWAVPNTEAIEAIKNLNMPIIEIGAGSGYWAKLISNAGVDVVAFDKRLDYVFTQSWFDVKDGSIEMIKDYPGRAMMLCWPCYQSSFAYEATMEFMRRGGNTMIYIGEDSFGCTGDDKFHRVRQKYWDCTQVVNIPQWGGIHDFMEILTRK